MSKSLLEGYLIKIIFSEANPKKEIIFLQKLCDKTENFEYLNKNYLFADNSVISLYIISKLINQYSPLIWVYELKEFMEFKLPKNIRKLAQTNEEFYSKSIVNQLDKFNLEELGEKGAEFE
ncbi:MAG: hypothetical protein HeimC3_01440 [Candidatus Heimdallarchaeota archaeon LC_3]|nr:MAG: hypothetical protein HeimC3_01440 [Candidatus Heimdallarchaeota archaeon LC_3]